MIFTRNFAIFFYNYFIQKILNNRVFKSDNQWPFVSINSIAIRDCYLIISPNFWIICLEHYQKKCLRMLLTLRYCYWYHYFWQGFLKQLMIIMASFLFSLIFILNILRERYLFDIVLFPLLLETYMLTIVRLLSIGIIQTTTLMSLKLVYIVVEIYVYVW